jgi:hypothetical protein
MASFRRLVVVGSGVVAAAGLLAACSSPRAQTSPPGIPSSGAPTVSRAGTGLVPAPRGLTDRLVLSQSHVPAGTAIKGVLVVTYRGHAPINLNRYAPRSGSLWCRPGYAVAVTNHRIPPEVAFAGDCSQVPLIIKPGVNRLPVTVSTRYGACGQVATRFSPACLRGREPLPPLPSGRYEAVLVGSGLPLPAPAPVPVSLGPAR